MMFRREQGSVTVAGGGYRICTYILAVYSAGAGGGPGRGGLCFLEGSGTAFYFTRFLIVFFFFFPFVLIQRTWRGSETSGPWCGEAGCEGFVFWGCNNKSQSSMYEYIQC